MLLYFLLAQQTALLLELLGRPLHVPLSVYDPADRDLEGEALRRPELLSEIWQAVKHYEITCRAKPDSRDPEARVRVADALYAQGAIETVELNHEELRLAAELQSRHGAKAHGIRAPLGPGEAACVAIAWSRGWTLVTDDSDALRVLEQLSRKRQHPYERIRKLLIRAALSELVTREQANQIHGGMRGFGFWDSTPPFP